MKMMNLIIILIFLVFIKSGSGYIASPEGEAASVEWDNILNKFITAVDNIYIYMSGTTATLNETKLNSTIDLRAGTNAPIDSDWDWAGNDSLVLDNTTIIRLGNTSWVNNTVTSSFPDLDLNSGDDWNWANNDSITLDNQSILRYPNNESYINYTIDQKLQTIYYNATQLGTIRGTPQGVLSYILSYDNNPYNVTEENPPGAGMDFRVNFTGVGEFNQLIFRTKDIATGSITTTVYLWDYEEGIWESYAVLSDLLDYTVKEIGVYDSTEHVGTGADLGKVQMRFYQPNNGLTSRKHLFDWVILANAVSIPSGREVDPHSIHTDDINNTQLYYDVVLNINNTWLDSFINGMNLNVTTLNVSGQALFTNANMTGNITAYSGVFNYVDKKEITEPSTPPSGTLRLYVVEQNGFSRFNYKDDLGVVRTLNDDEIIVNNTRGSTIAAHRVVYVNGYYGGIPTVDLARADNISTMPEICVTIESIANNGLGRCMVSGLLENVNTNDYEVGLIYVSATTAGLPTNTPPITPNLTQEIGTILVKDAVVGKIQIVSRTLTGIETGTINNYIVQGNLSALGDLHYFLGNVGIGTTNPVVPLHVAIADGNENAILIENNDWYSTKTTSGDLRGLFQMDDNNHTIINAGNGEEIRFTIGVGDEKLTLLDSGNVGIGTTTPNSLLHVEGGDILISGSSPGIFLNDTDGTMAHPAGLASDGTTTTVYSGRIAGGGFYDLALRVGDPTVSSFLIAHGDAVTRNFGIGTTNPTSKLHVIGEVNATGYTGQPYGYAELDDDGTSSTAEIAFGSGSAETTSEYEMTWDSTNNEFNIEHDGIYEATLIAGITTDTNQGNNIRIRVDDVIKNSRNSYTHTVTDPSTHVINWVGSISSGSVINATMDSTAGASDTFKAGSTFTVRRIG